MKKGFSKFLMTEKDMDMKKLHDKIANFFISISFSVIKNLLNPFFIVFS
jgi:hypothetical protein